MRFMLVFVLLFIALQRCPATAEDTSRPIISAHASALLAPADLYFGDLRMSILGIRNAINDIAARLTTASPKDLASLYHKLSLVNDSMLDLKSHYPRDSWLPDLGLRIATAFTRFPYQGAQLRANDTFDWIIAEFPATKQAFSASDLRRARVDSTSSGELPIEPTLPADAVPRKP